MPAKRNFSIENSMGPADSLAWPAVSGSVRGAWLARYRFGPLEWLWRVATYARVANFYQKP